jgi:hypothetical protein
MHIQPHCALPSLKYLISNQHAVVSPPSHALKISDAPEPSDVKYENIEHDAGGGLGLCA